MCSIGCSPSKPNPDVWVRLVTLPVAPRFEPARDAGTGVNISSLDGRWEII